MMMYRQQGLQKKYCKAEQYCFGVWGQAETSLKIVDLSWKYPKNNEQIKIKRQWLSPWGHFRDSRALSWLSELRTDTPSQRPYFVPH
jgi:hypothetical protein